MTPAVCETYCSSISVSSYYPLFGLEYGSQCYCGSSLAQQKPERVEEYWCGVPCMGNNTLICGGTWYISLYNITTAPVAKTVATTSVAPTSTPLPSPSSTSSSAAASSTAPQNASAGVSTTSSYSANVGGSPSPLVPQATVIAIGVVAALFAVALFGVIAYLTVFRRRWKKHLETQQEREIASTMTISSSTDIRRGTPPAEMWSGPAEMSADKSKPGSPRVTLPPIPPTSPSITRASINTAATPFVSEHYHKGMEY
ncbi:hypothetical protein Vi05172_g11603 [Venturia inaequalis]|uniref:WSC domain-containing protein n=1 Tax=Venturia inaequalis TaxID=5025 RepID=A0A8H3YYW2_VENIN|nr:hypothetical protein EG327_008699 [Venturia inaequalis]RDI78401.1 hypothetical protein Vi05172_g11603 [Venturia inaequalis]